MKTNRQMLLEALDAHAEAHGLRAVQQGDETVLIEDRQTGGEIGFITYDGSGVPKVKCSMPNPGLEFVLRVLARTKPSDRKMIERKKAAANPKGAKKEKKEKVVAGPGITYFINRYTVDPVTKLSKLSPVGQFSTKQYGEKAKAKTLAEISTMQQNEKSPWTLYSMSWMVNSKGGK